MYKNALCWGNHAIKYRITVSRVECSSPGEEWKKFILTETAEFKKRKTNFYAGLRTQ